MRFEQWERRLNAIVSQYQRMPFEWGKRDCVLFAADAVWAVTQKDPAAQWRWKYASEEGAAQIVAEAGGLEALTEAGLSAAGIEFERIGRNFAQRGDICLFESKVGPALGVVLGAHFAAKAKDGLARVPIEKAGIVWAIR